MAKKKTLILSIHFWKQSNCWLLRYITVKIMPKITSLVMYLIPKLKNPSRIHTSGSHTSSALFNSSSECSALLLCSVWWSEESMSQEKELDSISSAAAVPSLSHKLMPGACSAGRGPLESTSDSSALKDKSVQNHVPSWTCVFAWTWSNTQ